VEALLLSLKRATRGESAARRTLRSPLLGKPKPYSYAKPSMAPEETSSCVSGASKYKTLLRRDDWGTNPRAQGAFRKAKEKKGTLPIAIVTKVTLGSSVLLLAALDHA
jgi:hypothetical protein